MHQQEQSKRKKILKSNISRFKEVPQMPQKNDIICILQKKKTQKNTHIYLIFPTHSARSPVLNPLLPFKTLHYS